MRKLLTLGLSSLATGPAFAAELAVTIEVPQLKVAEYHRPYVASWIETSDGGLVANLGVWYDTAQRDNGGNKWLKDMRLWWRRAGRALEMPVDGLSSPTRPPGKHDVDLTFAEPKIAGLADGQYALVVEAAREVGGREVVRIPFQWPPQAEESKTVSGAEELGAITLRVQPK
ncbi:conserved exported protein of unknown function [Candidatus Filomicrobium marinum]|uniref:DUF2271 domain-containing protein n=2 Tax=Filomicrobium TaxID=119044 RepID=A0A0D6JCE3_9HYPH|nr:MULTISPECIES: DUF2271 domain-containing protein [Filomicrobium]MCV0370490.1 DUF2271 domain-containing protein [Filomicrobium sp.]CFX08579.1 conserved exported protein of unknown function [Candidatus Filomicrobium marinum]CPR16811.1 conserved exported protein of unknown function [Candidatus Filomicrobium marinum]SDO44634.1 Hypothetical protein SAMN04488061_1202 [Filomicrobium insigne]